MRESDPNGDLNGVIGVGESDGGADVVLVVKVGKVYHRKDEEGEPCIQVICSMVDEGRGEIIGELFETDDLQVLGDDLRNGVLPWYGDVIRFRVATPGERVRIARRMGW